MEGDFAELLIREWQSFKKFLLAIVGAFLRALVSSFPTTITCEGDNMSPCWFLSLKIEWTQSALYLSVNLCMLVQTCACLHGFPLPATWFVAFSNVPPGSANRVLLMPLRLWG